jgi:hypothetical protein
MHSDLLMHVSAIHVQDRIHEADYRRQVKEARSTSKAGAVSRRRLLRWHVRRFPAQPVTPTR